MVWPYQVTQVLQHSDTDLVDKPRYTIRNQLTEKDSIVDITHLRTFNFDTVYVPRLNITVKDTDDSDGDDRTTRFLKSPG